MEKFNTECLVIGGGASGLAIARNLSQSKEIFLIEKNNSIGQETSSRNSEVIHGVLYYKPDSLKSELCLRGKFLLYEYLQKNNLPYSRCGKYVISTSSEEDKDLHVLFQNAKNSGVNDLLIGNEIELDYDFLKYSEFIFSPSTGIFDSMSYMNSLKNEIEQNGSLVLLGNKLLNLEIKQSGVEAHVQDLNNNQEFIISTKTLVNTAGLEAVRWANHINQKEIFTSRLLKGEYYSYSGKEKLNHLIYPLPTKDSLGAHATIDLGKGIRFGPSAYEVDEEDYGISKDQKKNFYKTVLKYWPSLDSKDLKPAYTGIRPLLKGIEDFVIDIKTENDNALISVLGYSSPGLTSSLALGEKIQAILHE